MFYLGMTLEYERDRTAALAIYINYSDFSPLSRYRSLMEGRYQAITRELIREQFRVLLSEEQDLNARETPKNSVAVFPLVYQGENERFAGLGIGLSEMMITDLGQVSELRLIERIRIEELEKELRFGTSGVVDQSTAPRVGHLLSAGRIVSGTFTVSGDNTMRMDVSTLDVGAASPREPTTESDALENLFKMQKEVVFKLIKDMGITLTRAEREKIQRIPTKNLQAFIAYSLGLEKEGEGDYEAAGVYFRQANELDPNFEPAQKKIESVEAISMAGGPKEHALASAYSSDPPPPPDAGERGGNLITDRIGKVQGNIGSGFVPGQDSRKPAEEATGAGAAVGELPPPPPPPPPPK
jgi:TolB-like protein